MLSVTCKERRLLFFLYKEDPMAKTFQKIMNTFLVLVLLMGVLSETINVFGEEEGNLEKESVESSFKAIWEKIEEEKYALPKTGSD